MPDQRPLAWTLLAVHEEVLVEFQVRVDDPPDPIVVGLAVKFKVGGSGVGVGVRVGVGVGVLVGVRVGVEVGVAVGGTGVFVGVGIAGIEAVHMLRLV